MALERDNAALRRELTALREAVERFGRASQARQDTETALRQRVRELEADNTALRTANQSLRRWCKAIDWREVHDRIGGTMLRGQVTLETEQHEQFLADVYPNTREA